MWHDEDILFNGHRYLGISSINKFSLKVFKEYILLNITFFQDYGYTNNSLSFSKSEIFEKTLKHMLENTNLKNEFKEIITDVILKFEEKKCDRISLNNIKLILA